MSKLLIHERPLQVLPKLAEKIGLNEAIILQQVHYWLNTSGKKIDGRNWIYNSYADWEEQFPFWSISTIRRTITSLENQNLLIHGNYNKMKFDNTKWYTINYDEVNSLSRPSVQNEQTSCSDWTDGLIQNEQANTIDYSKSTTENYIYTIFQHWNEQGIIKHRKMNQAMKSHINARLEEYSVDELKKAIENYSFILNSNSHYWTHKWSLQDFMKPNNVIRFVDEAEPLNNFKSNQTRKGKKELNINDFNLDD